MKTMFKSEKNIILGAIVIVVIVVFFLIILDKKRDLNQNQNQRKDISETYPLDISPENVLKNWQKEKSYGVIINK